MHLKTSDPLSGAYLCEILLESRSCIYKYIVCAVDLWSKQTMRSWAVATLNLQVQYNEPIIFKNRVLVQ